MPKIVKPAIFIPSIQEFNECLDLFCKEEALLFIHTPKFDTMNYLTLPNKESSLYKECIIHSFNTCCDGCITLVVKVGTEYSLVFKKHLKVKYVYYYFIKSEAILYDKFILSPHSKLLNDIFENLYPEIKKKIIFNLHLFSSESDLVR